MGVGASGAQPAWGGLFSPLSSILCPLGEGNGTMFEPPFTRFSSGRTLGPIGIAEPPRPNYT